MWLLTYLLFDYNHNKHLRRNYLKKDFLFLLRLFRVYGKAVARRSEAESKAWQKKVLLILSNTFHIHTREWKVYEREFFPEFYVKVNKYGSPRNEEESRA